MIQDDKQQTEVVTNVITSGLFALVASLHAIEERHICD